VYYDEEGNLISEEEALKKKKEKTFTNEQ